MNGVKYKKNKLPSLKIGDLIVATPLFLAPMVGISHIALRQLIASFGGCGVYVSEMLSARRIKDDILKNSVILKHLPNEKPFFFQIVGNDPVQMVSAINHLDNYQDITGISHEGIDINMGCSAPSIRKNGLGSGLMKETEKAKNIISSCRQATNLPLTVKMRIGERESFEDLLTFATALQNEGIDAVILHPRLIKEKFKRAARWKYVKMLKESLKIPVIGNGDISDIHEIDMRFRDSKCDGIMLGRTAIIKPWIFKEYENGYETPVDHKKVYFQFIDLLNFYFESEVQIKLIKKFTSYYTRNFKFGHHFEMKINNAIDMKSVIEISESFFQKMSSSL